jgi:hypothetical protein
MIENLVKNTLYSFKIKGFSNKLRGLFLQEGKDWVLVKTLFTDYMLDGYQLLNKKYILSINQSEDDIFTEKVLVANGKNNIEYISFPLSMFSLFEYLLKQNIVFSIQTNKEDRVNIGSIDKLSDKSIFITPINPKGIWEKSRYYTFRKEFIRIIEFDTDYINSLENYSKSLK